LARKRSSAAMPKRAGPAPAPTTRKGARSKCRPPQPKRPRGADERCTNGQAGSHGLKFRLPLKVLLPGGLARLRHWAIGCPPLTMRPPNPISPGYRTAMQYRPLAWSAVSNVRPDAEQPSRRCDPQRRRHEIEKPVVLGRVLSLGRQPPRHGTPHLWVSTTSARNDTSTSRSLASGSRATLDSPTAAEPVETAESSPGNGDDFRGRNDYLFSVRGE